MFQDEKEQTQLFKVEYLSGKELSFREVSFKWLNSIQLHAKQSTLVKYHNFLENHIFPMIGSYPISAIDTACLEQMLLQKLSQGRLDGQGGLSVKTVKDMLSVIREIIYFANVHGYGNMCSLSAISIKNPEKHFEILGNSDQKKLEKFLLNNPTLRNIGILMSLYMGLRIGEVCALRWQDIHLKEKALYVNHTMQRIQHIERVKETDSKTIVVITPPKSQSSIRVIPIPYVLHRLLKDIHCDKPGAFLLTGDSNRYIEPRNLQYYFRKVLKTIDIELYNFHILRHTFATRCIESGFDVKSLSEILGHSNVNITLNRYMHSSFEWKKKNMQLLEQWTVNRN